jgi:hypothetical protein
MTLNNAELSKPRELAVASKSTKNHGVTSRMLEAKDFGIGTVIVVLMAVLFASVGGRPLTFTFIPGLFVSWLIYLWMYRNKTELPEWSTFSPIYFLTIAWQFIHFTEEYLTGFYNRFPSLYGHTPYPLYLFISFNMVSYFVFVVACLLVFTKSLKFLAVPVLFFLVYGAMGNAITHTWWVILQKSYFPGFYTAQVYWILGPLALSTFIGSRRTTLLSLVLLAAILIPMVTVFIQAN